MINSVTSTPWILSILIAIIVIQGTSSYRLTPLSQRKNNQVMSNLKATTNGQGEALVAKHPDAVSSLVSHLYNKPLCKSLFPAHTNEPSLFYKMKRRATVFWVAFQIFLDYKMAQRTEKKIRKKLGISEEADWDDYPEIVKLWNAVHDKNAKTLSKQIMKLTGFWVKVGQFLSSRSDIMPPAYLEELKSLQDSLPPKSFEDVKKTIREQLSEEELSMIKHINPKPLATASIAQVHRATLTNEHEVVIKVQHRGVTSLVLQDMENLRSILEFLAKFEKDADFRVVVDEYTQEIKKELDFRTEAQNMDDVRTLLEELDVRVIVPKAIPNLVKERVLVMDFCEGFPIRDVSLLDAHNVDRNKLLDRVCAAWAAQMHIGGVFNADPHMGNILVSTVAQEDGDTSIPILLDFGLTKRFDPHMKRAFSRLMHALDETDVDSLLTSFDEMGMKLNRYDPFQDMSNLQRGFSDPVPLSDMKQASKEKQAAYERRLEAQREDHGLKKGQKLRNPVDAWPQELIMFGRVTNMLRGLCSTLNVPYPYLKTMATAARKTLMEDVPMQELSPPQSTDGSVITSIDTKLQHELLATIDTFQDTDDMIGLQICVFQDGKEVANIAQGVLGRANPRPVTPSTLFCVFSVSKAVLTMGLLRLVQDGFIESLDDPIHKYWPSFAAKGKQNITIRHALTHQAGLANVFPEKISIESLLDWSHMKDVIASSEPTHAPGEETQYHYLSYGWICGGIIEHVTGKPYEEYLNETIILPLQMQHSIYMGGLPPDLDYERNVAVLSKKRDTIKYEQKRADLKAEEKMKYNLEKHRGVEQLMNISVFNMKQVRQAKLPSANGHTSAYALASLFDKFIDTDKDHSLTTSKILEEVRTKQMSMSAITKKREGKTLTNSQLLDDSSSAFGLGLQLHDLTLPDGKVVSTIGHAGVGGSVVFAIPELKISVAFTTNCLSQTPNKVKERLLKIIMEEFKLTPPPSQDKFFFEGK